MKPFLVLTCLGLVGCAQMMPSPDMSSEFDLQNVLTLPEKGVGGGVFTPVGHRGSLVADNCAFRAGDVLTVVLEETTQASKKAGTLLGKQTDTTVTPTLIGNATLNSRVGIEANRHFDGTSSSTQQNRLFGVLTVIVHKVFANGLLLVQGEKQLTLNQGDEFVRVTGYVRINDIDPDNKVSSLRIANARITYSGRGVLNDANAPGWLTRFFTSPWMPF